MINFPKLKKNINSFLKDEEGKITKASLVKNGTIIAIGLLSTIPNIQNVEGQTCNLTSTNIAAHNSSSVVCQHQTTHSNSAACSFLDTDSISLVGELKVEHNHSISNHQSSIKTQVYQHCQGAFTHSSCHIP
jgi:hypothetical protein